MTLPIYKEVSELTEKGYELIEWPNGNKYWYLNGKLHREDGPAVERSDGSKSWYLNGEFHREDGPAIEYSDGNKFWLFNGKEISLETKSEDPRVKSLQEFMKLDEILGS
jgi:hypothetical protein